MNLSDIWAECGRLLGDPNNDKWSQAVLTTRANLAQTEIEGATKAIKTSASLTPVASTAGISVLGDTGLTVVMDILYATKTKVSGEIVPFNGIKREALDYLYPDWKQWQQGEPLLWYYDATNGQMILVPAPDSSNAISSGITVITINKPTDMSVSTDSPFGGYTTMIPYHIAVVHWVVAQCFMDDGTPEALGKARFHKSGSMLSPGEYEKQLGRIMAEFDTPEAVPANILYRPQGGRIGSFGFPSKSNPLPW